MASIKEIDLIRMSKGFKPDVRYFIRDSFGCEEFVQQVSYPINQDLIREKDVIINHGKDVYNHFIEIHQIEPPKIVSKFYSEYDPLLIIYEASFYTQFTVQRVRRTYQKLFDSPRILKQFWSRISEAYKNLKDKTSFSSDDISANNILVKPDFSDFKIIDVLSLRKNYTSTLNPHTFFFTNKYPKHMKDETLATCLGGANNMGKINGMLQDLESTHI